MIIIEYKNKEEVMVRLVGCADRSVKYLECTVINIPRAQQAAETYKDTVTTYADRTSEEFTEHFLKYKDVCARHTLRCLRKIERYITDKK